MRMDENGHTVLLTLIHEVGAGTLSCLDPHNNNLLWASVEYGECVCLFILMLVMVSTYTKGNDLLSLFVHNFVKLMTMGTAFLIVANRYDITRSCDHISLFKASLDCNKG